MKKLMKLTLVLIVSASTTTIYAQKFGVVAGLNLANMHDKDESEIGTTSKVGFHVGGTIELPINDNFSFASGAIFSTKGFKYDMSEDYMGMHMSAELTANMMYIDIPLTAKGSWDITRNMKVYGLLGPYCAIGVGGKMESNFSFMGQSESASEDIPWGTDGLSRFDMGFTAGTGVSFNAVSVGVSYQYGLMNDLQNRLLSFSVGYQFEN